VNDALIADIDAERALLSSVWLSNDAEMIRQLEPQDFADSFHVWVYRKLRETVDAGEPLDIVAVQRRWKKPGGLDGLTKHEQQYLAASVAELLNSAPTTAHTTYYFTVLRTERLRRATCKLADEMTKRAALKHAEPSDVLTWAKEQIEKLLTKTTKREFPQIGRTTSAK
jgi:replicative DNA helicase